MVLDSHDRTIQEVATFNPFCRDGAVALSQLTEKVKGCCSTARLSPAPPKNSKGHRGKDKVNDRQSSDVIFIVEGREFYAHRDTLSEDSDAFAAMFNSGYRETTSSAGIEIPNISYQVFEAMMNCIYTGSVEIKQEIAEDLLQVADQYLLNGLKHLCEIAISGALTVEN
eukprot:scaffold666083_cov76-Prasinocladus_malaysianus.AAC.1